MKTKLKKMARNVKEGTTKEKQKVSMILEQRLFRKDNGC